MTAMIVRKMKIGKRGTEFPKDRKIQEGSKERY